RDATVTGVQTCALPISKFSNPPRQQAEQIYQHYVNGGVPAADDYRIFQDYIFRYLISEGGRLHLPVHIHSAVGIGDYFNISEARSEERRVGKECRTGYE